MNTQSESHGTAHRDNDDALGRLIRQAGRRQTPPEAVYRDVLDAASGAWREKVSSRRRRRAAFAVAATILLGLATVGLIQRFPGSAPAPVPVAKVDHGFGPVVVKNPLDERWQTLAGSGFELVEGARVRIGDAGGLNLRLSGNGSLRIAEQTEISLASARDIYLDRGAVYLDTERNRGRDPIQIHTALGSLQHVGTQFEARYTVNELRLRVREGSVLLHRGEDVMTVESGHQVTVNFEGEAETTRISSFGDQWAWVEALATMPDTNEQPLSAFLEWFSRETGRNIHFANSGLKTRAYTTILHGRTERLVPMEALGVMLQTTDFQYTVTGEGEILIEDRRP